MATPEKPRHMGKYWCWVFWEFKVDVLRSVDACERKQNERWGDLGHTKVSLKFIW